MVNRTTGGALVSLVSYSSGGTPLVDSPFVRIERPDRVEVRSVTHGSHDERVAAVVREDPDGSLVVMVGPGVRIETLDGATVA
jgi:hypothetical protein